MRRTCGTLSPRRHLPMTARQKRIAAVCLALIGAMVLFPPQASPQFFEGGQLVSESIHYGFIAGAESIAYQRLGLQVAGVVLLGGAYLFLLD